MRDGLVPLVFVVKFLEVTDLRAREVCERETEVKRDY